jgi:leader peptidase (prepilin peptidase)/N-methyltransferase
MLDFGLAWILGLVIGFIEASLLTYSIERLGHPGSSLFSGGHSEACPHDRGLLGRIPVLGYILNRGKCPVCGARLSAQPLLWELPFILVAIWLFSTQPLLLALEATVFVAALIGLAVIDLKAWLIPNFFLLVILMLMVFELLMGSISFPNAIQGLGVGMIVSLFLLTPQYLDKSYGELALGDVKLALVLGLWMGWVLSIYVFFLASVLAFLWWMFSGVIQGFSAKRRLAFGPFVALWAAILGLGKMLDPQFVTHLMSFRF